MLSALKRVKSNKKDSNEGLSPIRGKIEIDTDLYNTIYEKVTKKTHSHESPQKNKGGTIKKCIELFEKGDDPNVLTELEQSLSKLIELTKSPKQKKEYQKHYKYYIENFLPALKDEVIKSEKLAKPPVLNNERKQSQRPQTKRGTIVGIISDITNRSSDKDHSGITIQNQNGRRNSQIDRQDNANTPELGSGSDSVIDLPRTSEESLESPISSRRSSVSSMSSAVKKDNDSQKEGTENQMQPDQNAIEEPKVQESGNSGDQVKEQVSSQCLTLGSREKESMDPNSQTTQMTGSQVKDSMQPEEKKDKKNAITTVQKLPVNEKKGEDTPPTKQPNNRNLHVALVAGCALLAIGCLVACAMTSGLVGAGLFAMAAVFVIATAAELHSNFLSSKLTSINVSSLVESKQL